MYVIKSSCQKLSKLSHSYLQNKISEEVLFHKKKIAEFEVERKMLELERLQWDFHKEKYQSDIRWSYEHRMMQYVEQRLKRNIMET